MCNTYTYSHAYVPDILIASRLGTGGTVAANGDAEIQGDHVINVTKFLLSREDHLIQVAGCGKKAKEREEKKRLKEESEALEAARAENVEEDAAARREEEGKKPRWSSTKKDAVARQNHRPNEPKGWSDDPRRCPFGWLYCSGVCMGLTPAEFKATRQHVWIEETEFYAQGSHAVGSGVASVGAGVNSFGKNETLGEELLLDLSSRMSVVYSFSALASSTRRHASSHTHTHIHAHTNTHTHTQA